MTAASFSDRALAYLTEHAIRPEVAHAAGVREDANALTLPCLDAEGLPTVRRRTLNGSGPKVMGEAGRSLGLTWWHQPPETVERVIVCEGEADALAALSAIRDSGSAARMLARAAIVSVPSTGFPPDRLVRALSAAGARAAALAYDSDDAGRKAGERARVALVEAGITAFPVRLPEGADVADLLARVQPSDRAEALANALLNSECGPDADGDAAMSASEPTGDPLYASDAEWEEWESARLARVAEGEPSVGTKLRFVSAADLRSVTPEEPEWVWEGYVARGAITLLAGKPKVGKSTAALALVEAVVAGAPSFLGRRVSCGSVVYVSEEAAGTLVGKLPADDRVRVLTRDAAWPKPSWAAVIGAAVEEATRVGAGLLVVDTFAFWSDLAAEREKDAGAVQQTMNALVAATRAGLAVLLIHHQRKAGGEGGDAIRGSSALAGAADALIELERPAGDAPVGHRQLVAVTRWPGTPGLLVVERDAALGAWRIVGEGASREEGAALAWRERLLRAVPGEPGATLDELEKVVGVERRKWYGEFKSLLSEGLIVRSGEGKRGDPYRHFQAPADSVPAFRTEDSTETYGDAPGEIPSSRTPPVGGGRTETSPDEIPFSVPDAHSYGNPAQNRNGGAPTLLDVEGSEEAVVRRLIDELDATELTDGPAEESL